RGDREPSWMDGHRTGAGRRLRPSAGRPTALVGHRPVHRGLVRRAPGHRGARRPDAYAGRRRPREPGGRAMTVLSEAPVPAAPPAETAPPAAPVRKRRRRHRIAIPFTVLLTLVVGTFVLHSLNEPDRTEATFLSPMSTADGTPISGSLLAQ